MIIYICERMIVPDSYEESHYWEPVKAVYTKEEAESYVNEKFSELDYRNFYPLELE